MEDGKIAIAEAAHFDGVPMESLEDIAADFQELTEWELLKKLGCWNRSRRKAVMKSKAIIIHLFSGRQEKESEKDRKGHFVMSIDNLTGMDVRNGTLWALLLGVGYHRWAAMLYLLYVEVSSAKTRAFALSGATLWPGLSGSGGEMVGRPGHGILLQIRVSVQRRLRG